MGRPETDDLVNESGMDSDNERLDGSGPAEWPMIGPTTLRLGWKGSV